MTNQAKDIRKHSFTDSNRLFLDTNVWIYIHYGIYESDETKRQEKSFYKNWYTTAFNKMRQSGSLIFIDTLVLSEFINTFAQLEYNRKVPKEIRLPKKDNYKIFRKSPDGQDTAREIVIQTNKILGVAQLCDLNYNFIKSKLPTQLKEYEKFNSDFNDLIYIELCKEYDFTLVTHDVDFKNCNVKMLTANNKLLDIK